MCTAKCRSISGAAKQLYVTQPNISNAIKSVENEFGISIFERTNTGVNLTAEGTLFLRRINPIFEQYERLENFYVGENKNQVVFSIAAQHIIFSDEVLGELLNSLDAVTYRIQYLECMTRDVIGKVAKGESEIGILFKRIGNDNLDALLESSKLSFYPIIDANPYVYIDRQHPLVGNSIITDDDLEPYPFIEFYQGNDDVNTFSEEIIKRKPPKKIVYVTDMLSMRMIARKINGYNIGSGLGIRLAKLDSGVIIPYDTQERLQMGYILRKDMRIEGLLADFIDKLESIVPYIVP
jgi:DNA-binding transcriptional LysR family regulator